MFASVIPTYEYTVSHECEDAQKAANSLKDSLVNVGGNISQATSTCALIEIAENKLSFGFMAFPGVLLISIEPDGAKELKVKVKRKTERTAFILFLILCLVITIGAFFQKGEIKVFLLPILLILIGHGHTFLPMHPAHKKIIEMIRSIA